MKKQSMKTAKTTKSFEPKIAKRVDTQELLKTALGALEESAARFEYCKFYVNQRAMEIAIDAIQEVQVSMDEL
jgi:hypothetical protein